MRASTADGMEAEQDPTEKNRQIISIAFLFALSEDANFRNGGFTEDARDALGCCMMDLYEKAGFTITGDGAAEKRAIQGRQVQQMKRATHAENIRKEDAHLLRCGGKIRKPKPDSSDGPTIAEEELQTGYDEAISRLNRLVQQNGLEGLDKDLIDGVKRAILEIQRQTIGGDRNRAKDGAIDILSVYVEEVRRLAVTSRLGHHQMSELELKFKDRARRRAEKIPQEESELETQMPSEGPTKSPIDRAFERIRELLRSAGL